MDETSKTGSRPHDGALRGEQRPLANPREVESATGSRRRRGGLRGASKGSARLLIVSEAALILAVLSAPLMLGSVPLWSVGVGLLLGAVSFGAVAISHLLARRKLPIHPLSWVLLGVLTFEALQLLPLPPGFLGAVSPRAAELFGMSLSSTDAWPSFRPLSLDPIATGVAVARHGSWLLILLAATALSTRKERAKRLVFALGISVVLVIVVAFAQKLAGTDLILGLYPTRPGGWLFATFVNPNHLGAFLDLLAPVCLGLALATRDRTRAALWALTFILAGATCLLTLSRGGIVALVIGVTVFSIFYKRLRVPTDLEAAAEAGPGSAPPAPSLLLRLRAAAAVFGPVILVGGTVAVGAYLALEPILAEVSTLIDQEQMADEVRWSIWSAALLLIKDFWAVGIGREAFAVAYPLYKDIPGHVTFSHAENQLVQAVAELGIPVAAAFVAALVATWLSVARRTDLPLSHAGLLAGLAGLAVHELTDFATSFGGVAVPAAVAIGVLMAKGLSPGSRVRRVAPGIALTLWILVVLAGSVGLARAPGSLADDVLEEVVSRLESGEPLGETVALGLRLRPTDHMLALVAARESLERGEPAEAMHWVNLAIYLAPSESRGHLLAAEALARAGRSRQALLQYRLAAEWGEPTRRVLGLAAARFSAPEKLARAVPDSAEGRRELVRFLASRGRHEEALELGREALLAGMEDLELLVATARSARRLGRLEETKSLAEAILAIDPREGRAHGLLASARLARGEVDEAILALEEGLELLPGDVSLSMQLARVLLLRKGDPEAGLEVLDAMRIPASDRGRGRMHALRGDAYRARGRTRRAMEEYRTAVRFAPDDPGPWISMGDHLMSMDQYERALEAYLEARRIRSSDAVEARVERAEERVRALREFRARERFLGAPEQE